MELTKIHGLEFQARAMCPYQGDDRDISFFVGTQTLKQETNQVHLIRLDDEERVKSNIFSHPYGEIWSLNASAHNKRLLVSCYNQTGGALKNQVVMKAALLTTPEELQDDEIMPFEMQDLHIPSNNNTASSEIKTAVFHPSDSESMAVVSDTKIHVLKLDGGDVRQICEAPAQGNGKFKSGKWALHNHGSQFLSLFENSVVSYDVRDMNKVAWTINHEQMFRDLDCNPHKPCHIVTGSDEGCIKIWDFRNIKEPVFSRNDHSHWVWTVRYNTFHDQLILSSSSDSRVNVTCAISASSEATTSADPVNDCLLESLDYHDDSVYCVEWSGADPWTFASLSYDGRFVFRRISKEIKYKILL